MAKKKKLKKSVKYTLILALVLVISIVGATVIASVLNQEENNVATRSDNLSPMTYAPIDDSGESEELFATWQATWQENKQKNADYRGEVYFDSGLIALPFVQGATNDTYLRTNWETMEYDEYGSIFLDERNTLDDHNIIIYGHYAYTFKDPSRTQMFTPLEQLIEEENWEDNQYVNLVLEDEIRRYQIVAVYYCPLYEEDGYWYGANDDLGYYWTEYDEEYFKLYKAAIEENQFYDTGVDYQQSDRFLTLQTCVENREDLREIVVCKEIERITK